jgi:hypothetical protein
MYICGFFPFVFSRVAFVIRRSFAFVTGRSFTQHNLDKGSFAQYRPCDRPSVAQYGHYDRPILRPILALLQADPLPNTALATGLSFAIQTFVTGLSFAIQTLRQAYLSPNTHIVIGRSFTQAVTPTIYKYESERQRTGGPRAQRPLTTKNRIHTHTCTQGSLRENKIN